MIPIKSLLNRIRWDPEFGKGQFAVGYEDHISGGTVRVPFRDISFDAGDGFTFSFVDGHGVERMVPYHRIREVLRDGVLIWGRAP